MDVVCDLLVGPLLSRVLLPVDAALDDQLAEQTVDSALHALGWVDRSS